MRRFALVLFLLGLVACGGDGKRELEVYIWSEYMDPAILEDFEKATGVPVRLSFYETTEDMIAKLQHASGASQYDLVVAPNQAIPLLVRLGLIRALDSSKLANLGNLDEGFRDPSYDPGGKHSVAYQWGTVGIMVNREKQPDLPATWAVFFDARRQAGPFLLIDEMRDLMGAALIFTGHSPNSTTAAEVKEAGEAVLAAKRSERCEGFEVGAGAKNRVVAGSVDYAIVWNGDALRAIEEEGGEKFAYVIPDEGSVIWTDTMTIPSEAPHPEEAYRFVDFLLRPDIGARLSEFTKFASPNRASIPLLPGADRTNPVLYPPADVRAKLAYTHDLGADNALYDEIWTAVKAR